MTPKHYNERKKNFIEFCHNSALRFGTQKYSLAESAYFAGVLTEHHHHTGYMPPLLTINMISGRPHITKEEFYAAA